MPRELYTAVDGLQVDDYTSLVPNAGVQSGRQLKIFGQTANTSGSSAANQQEGTITLPVQAAAGTYTVALSNSLITAASLIHLSVVNSPAAGGAGDATAGRAVSAWIEGSPAAGSVTVAYHTDVAMSQAWSCHYRVTNGV